MKPMFYSFRETEGTEDLDSIGFYPTLEEAANSAKSDRNNLVPSEKAKSRHYVWQVNVPDNVNTLHQFYCAGNEDFSVGKCIKSWAIYTTEELHDIAENLGWDPTDKEDTLECLRTNWEEPLTEEEVQKTYEYLVDLWEQNHMDI